MSSKITKHTKKEDTKSKSQPPKTTDTRIRPTKTSDIRISDTGYKINMVNYCKT